MTDCFSVNRWKTVLSKAYYTALDTVSKKKNFNSHINGIFRMMKKGFDIKLIKVRMFRNNELRFQSENFRFTKCKIIQNRICGNKYF